MTKQTKELRRSGLGGSDLAAVLGLDPYKSAYELWCEKTGVIEPADLSDDDVVWFGSASEDLHAKFFERKTGFKVFDIEGTHRLIGHEHLMAHPDRAVIEHQGGDISRGLELKSTDAYGAKYWGEPSTDEIPVHYLPQVHTYMAVMDWSLMYVSVLIGRQLKVFKVERSKEWDVTVVDAADIFWNDYVLAKREPDLSYDRLTLGALKKAYRGVQQEALVYANDSIGALVNLQTDLKGRKDQLQLQLDAVDAELRHFAKDAEFVVLPGADYCLKKIHVPQVELAPVIRGEYSYLRRVKTPKHVQKLLTQQRKETE